MPENPHHPLLQVTHAGDGGTDRSIWWKKLFHKEEVIKQLAISFPMILTNVFYYLIPLISVMFAGHLGQLELAGATLANSWATVTGFAFMVGPPLFFFPLGRSEFLSVALFNCLFRPFPYYPRRGLAAHWRHFAAKGLGRSYTDA